MDRRIRSMVENKPDESQIGFRREKNGKARSELDNAERAAGEK